MLNVFHIGVMNENRLCHNAELPTFMSRDVLVGFTLYGSDQHIVHVHPCMCIASIKSNQVKSTRIFGRRLKASFFPAVIT